jgi:hypothetical protein
MFDVVNAVEINKSNFLYNLTSLSLTSYGCSLLAGSDTEYVKVLS